MSKGHGAAACLLQALILPLFLAEEGQKTGMEGGGRSDPVASMGCTTHTGGPKQPWHQRGNHPVSEEQALL